MRFSLRHIITCFLLACIAFAGMVANVEKIQGAEKMDSLAQVDYCIEADDDEEDVASFFEDQGASIKASHQHHHKKHMVRGRRRTVICSVVNDADELSVSGNFILSGADRSHALALAYDIPQPFYYTFLHRCSLF